MDDIPEEIKEFIRQYITSIGQLDVLLLLKRDVERVWTSAQVGSELRTNQTHAETHLQELLRSGLIEKVEGYRFTRDKTLVEKIEGLEQLYGKRRPSVIHFIYTQPIDRIRGFADAFKIKKE